MNDEIQIKKVNNTSGKIREFCKEYGLKHSDLILIETEYTITLIEGSPTEFIKERYLGHEDSIECDCGYKWFDNEVRQDGTILSKCRSCGKTKKGRVKYE